MGEEAFISKQEVLIQHSELKKLKVPIQDVKKMHYDIQQTTRHPIPPAKEQNLHLMNKIERLKIMKKEVQPQMKKMTDNNKERFAIVD